METPDTIAQLQKIQELLAKNEGVIGKARQNELVGKIENNELLIQGLYQNILELKDAAEALNPAQKPAQTPAPQS